MAERHSGRERMFADTYVTPQWVWDALYSVEPWARDAFDCCPELACFDFLECVPVKGFPALATNPPYKIAESIIRHALDQTAPAMGKVAMLLPHAYDTAKGRVDLFNHLPFKCKWTLTKRIRWANLPQSKAGPSMNHAWFVWDWKYIGPPKMGWLPIDGGEG